MKKNIQLFTIAITIFSLIVINPVSAIDKDFYSSNDILFYNPEDTACVTSSESVSLDKDDPTLQLIFQLLIDSGFNSIQSAAIMGNMYAESSFISDRHEVGNDIGYGLAQWSFGRRDKLEAFATSKNIDTSDIPMQIEFLINEYNESYKSKLSVFNESTDISTSTENWMMKFEAPKMSPANDPAALYSKRIPAAEEIYGFFSNLSPDSPKATSGCINGNSAIVGDMIQTAINYALPKPATTDVQNNFSDATESYQTAIKQYSPTADITDCGGFVGTVMISSKVDEDYPALGVKIQYDYVTSNPDKYQIIENPTESDLQPGDILITLHTEVNTQHTTIYTGNTPYPSVDASYGGRVPSVRDSTSAPWMISNGAIIARIIK